MKKRIFLLPSLFFFTLLISNAQLQFQQPGASSKYRKAANTPPYVKQVTFGGNDSVNYFYYQTQYTQIHWKGNINKVITVDTLRSKYIQTDYWEPYDDNQFLFYYSIDTTTNDTIAHSLATFSSNKRTREQRGKNAQGIYSNLSREVLIDSAGYNLYDSSFYWADKRWAFKNATRYYYTFSGKLTSNLYWMYTDTSGVKYAYMSKYTYQDTLLVKTETFSRALGDPNWGEPSVETRTYSDNYGSYTQTSAESHSLHISYGPENQYLGYEDRYWDNLTSSWKPSNYYRLKYNDEGNPVQLDELYGQFAYYKSFISYPSSLTIASTQPQSLPSTAISLYPNPAKEEMHIRMANPSMGVEEIIIRNALGKILFAGNGKEAVSLAGFQSGIYVVEVRTTEGIAVKTLVVQ